jgi:uncharacterized protein
MTPLLILLFGIQPATAVGTDLLFAAATKSVGSVVHGLARSIHWRVVGLLAIGSIPATMGPRHPAWWWSGYLPHGGKIPTWLVLCCLHRSRQ